MRNDELYDAIHNIRLDIFRLKKVVTELKHKVDVLESRQLPVEQKEDKEDYDYE